MRIRRNLQVFGSAGIACSCVFLIGCSANRQSTFQNYRAFDASSREASQLNQQPQAISLLGQQLFAPELEEPVRAQRLAQLEQTQRDYDRDLHNEQAIIWLGRRLAYLGKYREAIDAFSNGLAIHPASYRLLRHRGHRFITLRDFDRAIADLQSGAELSEDVPDEIEPDGQPNRLNIPTSTLHTNIFYHLGLAHYLQADFEAAERAYRRCMTFSKNDDMLVATSYWLYLTLQRLGQTDQAASVLAHIEPEMTVIENTSYHQLLLMFKNNQTVEPLSSSGAANQSIDVATIGYGLAMRDLLRGDIDKAQARFRDVIANSNWAAFGHIAAEVELARIAGTPTSNDQPH